MRYPLVLLVLASLLFVSLAIAPPDRLTWALENTLVLVGLALLWATRRTLEFSNLAYTLMFAFFVLHEIGAFYTYTLVPYDRWWQALTGSSLDAYFGWRRNQYDRLVHFAFGALLAYPMRELFMRLIAARGWVSYALPIQMTLSWSAIYELIEWLAASVFGADTGAAYVGAQGDAWDAQKDMALAASGAVLAMLAASTFRALREAAHPTA